ncbi:hypothetical protein Taro_044213 [Colocasia esculenta]|uniref:Uncharacterized protein n=1 Tax=Colocasia esculenta TaxID=4460 RepID=A0A843X292_COLES|nr:hypothetical protein [Colocasia esculenta]
MTAEKNLRGVLRSEVDRSVSKDNIIIVDSLNNIKGYRYELWCLARGAGIRYCVLFCDVEENICRQWNKERGEQEESTYDERIFAYNTMALGSTRMTCYLNSFADLAQRFERPDRRNRWDSPLFELMPSRGFSWLVVMWCRIGLVRQDRPTGGDV